MERWLHVSGEPVHHAWRRYSRARNTETVVCNVKRKGNGWITVLGLFECPLQGGVRLYLIFSNYSTSAHWIWVGFNHLVSNKRDWNNCFIKTPTKYREFFPTLFVKTTRFLACFLFWADAYGYHIWRVWYNGLYTMMARPIRALELHYPMIQFLIMSVIPVH